MVEKAKEKPFQSLLGKIDMDDGSFFRFQLKKNDEQMKPFSLTFTAFNKDDTPTNSLVTDSTLYFDAAGNIVDRAPINTITNVKKLKERYGAKLLEYFEKFGDTVALERQLIQGFLAPGEQGVQRERLLVKGKVERVLRREDI